MKSLHARAAELSQCEVQLKDLNQFSPRIAALPKFSEKLGAAGLFPLKASGIEIFQINVGKICNQVCKHCHVDAGPDRTEIMSRDTLDLALDVLRTTEIPTVDITGGAPEMNPHFQYFVDACLKLGRKVMVRSNLTILTMPKFERFPEFFREQRVHVVSSLPYYSKRNTDRQRGDGVFDRSIKALKILNELGYGRDDSGLMLDLVYNPSGAFLPAEQIALESDFKRELKSLFNIDFNHLFTITNMPISRYLEFLIESGNFEDYMETLVNAFNPAAANGVMCRNTLSVSWDGYLFDCDFNQMLEIPVNEQVPRHLRDFDFDKLAHREITLNQHCYGCTAGAGSSCGGSLT